MNSNLAVLFWLKQRGLICVKATFIIHVCQNASWEIILVFVGLACESKVCMVEMPANILQITLYVIVLLVLLCFYFVL